MTTERWEQVKSEEELILERVRIGDPITYVLLWTTTMSYVSRAEDYTARGEFRVESRDCRHGYVTCFYSDEGVRWGRGHDCGDALLGALALMRSSEE